MPIQVKVNYNGGDSMVGMPERQTWNRIAAEFAAPLPSCAILPLPEVLSDVRGRVIHETITVADPERFERDKELKLPIRTKEEKPRATIINSREDQLGMMGFWASAAMEFPMGSRLTTGIGNWNIGYQYDSTQWRCTFPT